MTLLQRMTVIKHLRPQIIMPHRQHRQPSPAVTTMLPQWQHKRLLRKMHTAAMTVTLRQLRRIMIRTQHLLRPRLTLPLIRMPTATLQPQSLQLLSRRQTIATHR